MIRHRFHAWAILLLAGSPCVPAYSQWDKGPNAPSLGGYPSSSERSSYTSGEPSAADSDAIFWSKNEFTIPFHVDANGKQPAEVQLEISTDRGISWSLYARDSLQVRQFRFASNQDGLYLFRIKTLDEAGQVYDPGGPPLKVFVDTRNPELNLDIDTDPQGRMSADFTIVDANVRSDSMKLEYQTEQQNRWTSIPVETRWEGADRVQGRGVWEVPLSARQLVVRLVVKDAAGNESEVTRLPLLPKTATGPGGLQFASGAATPRFGQSYATSNGSPSGGTSAPPQGPAALATAAPAATAFGVPYSNSPAKKTPAPTFVGTTPPRAAQPTASVASSGGRYELKEMPSSFPPTSSPAEKNDALYLEPSGIASGPLFGNHQDSTPRRAIDPDQIDPPLGTTRSITEKPFYSRSKTFSLDYEVDSSSATPVASIELWGTSDGGQLWERWGVDPDSASPFDIKVETDGLFGFRMVVIGANGLAGNRPRNGDNADAWIQVDTEPPTARILSALYGKGTEANSLVIEFQAADPHFGERPITLSFSEIPAGPWTTIANGIQNKGRFVWPADPTLPRRVYLKLEAHDEAGNIGEHRLDVPVDIEGLAPRGRIHGVRPIAPPSGS